MAEKVAINPLQHNVPIVNTDGRPTVQFMRQWELLVRELREAKQRIAELEEGP
jgi:hypothetical protein